MQQNDITILKENSKKLYDGFEGVVATIDPNTIEDKCKKKIFLKEVEYDGQREKHKAHVINEFNVVNNMPLEILNNIIQNMVMNIYSVAKPIAITSDLQKAMSS